MKLRIQYSGIQLEECVKFVVSRTPSYTEEGIRKAIREHMLTLAGQFPRCTFIGAHYGYCIECFIEGEEGMDEDTNLLRFEFYVDPASHIEQDSVTEELIIVPEEQ
jgi:hypothetical protein